MGVSFNEFKSFWEEEVEKKFYRCLKETGYYYIIAKRHFRKKEKEIFFKKLYRITTDFLLVNEKDIVVFDYGDICIKFPANCALSSKRFFSFVFCSLFMRKIRTELHYICVDNDNVMIMLYKEIFKKHKINKNFKKFVGYIKMILNL
jgi:hypothetical protein